MPGNIAPDSEGSDARAEMRAGPADPQHLGPPNRQNQASVLARSLLTVGPMQKPQAKSAALPDSRSRGHDAGPPGRYPDFCSEPAAV
jgi:hypothetical protein